MILELPFPPSANAYWRHNRGRTHLSEAAVSYRAAVRLLARSSRRGFAATDRLGVVVELFPPDKRRRDVDNCAKQLLDALRFAGVYDDDSQIDDLRLVREPVDRVRPRVRVAIRVLA